jgi:hypothetical protein
MDKGKVFRNLAKKKLAEYIQEKEAKGDQETHSETVPVTKDKIVKAAQRTPYKLNLEIEGKKGKYPFVVNANLSLVEKKRLMRVATAISNALKLDTASALAVRFENLLKKMTTEAENYSIDYIEALEGLIKNIYEKVRELVKKNQNINQAKNNLNQIIELLDEKKEEKRPMEEGIPALEEGEKELNIKIGKPSAEEEEEEEEGIKEVPELRFGEITGTDDLSERKREIKEELTDKFNQIYPLLPSVTLRDELYNLCNKFAKGLKGRKKLALLNSSYERVRAIIDELEEYVEPAAAPAAAAAEEEEEEAGGGHRKGRYGTHRGYIGYGEMPKYDKGFATAPMNANSPFGQAAFKAPQSNAIPKYLNFEIIPNKRGNFAYLA